MPPYLQLAVHHVFESESRKKIKGMRVMSRKDVTLSFKGMSDMTLIPLKSCHVKMKMKAIKVMSLSVSRGGGPCRI